MSDWNGDDDDDDDYFSEVEADYEPTGKEPKFVLAQILTMSPVQLDEMKVDELVKLYRETRDQLGTDRKGYKSREAKMKTAMSVISMILRDRGDKLGVDTFSTAYGTAFRNKKEKFTIDNWTDFTAYLDRTKNFQALQKRVSPNAIKEIRELEGAVPPGVASLEEVEFSVRAPSKRKS